MSEPRPRGWILAVLGAGGLATALSAVGTILEEGTYAALLSALALVLGVFEWWAASLRSPASGLQTTRVGRAVASPAPATTRVALVGLVGAAVGRELEPAFGPATLVAVGLVGLAAAVDARRHAGRLAVAGALAVALVGAASLPLARATPMSRALGHHLHVWNLYHYVLATKYFPEVGYFDLYPATIYADARRASGSEPRAPDGLRRPPASGLQPPASLDVQRVRDQRTYAIIPAADAVAAAEADGLAARFTPARLAAFQADLDTFFAASPPKSFSAPLTDFGFNPSPVWLVLHRPLLEAVGTEQGATLVWLAALQTPLQVAGLAAVAWAFGASPALWCLLWTLLFFGNEGRLFGGYFSYDWWALGLLAVSLVRAGEARLAAPLLAWIGLVRGFPAMLAFGPALRWIRCRDPADRALLFGAALTAVPLGLLSLQAGVGPSAWVDWLEKIQLHASYISAGMHRVGLATLFGEAWLTPGITEDMDVRRALLASRSTELHVVQAAVVLVSARVLSRRSSTDAMVLGLVPVFALTVLSRYYFATWVLWLLLDSTDRRRLGNLGVHLAMFAGLLGFHASRSVETLTLMERYHYVNLWILAMSAGLLGMYAWRDRGAATILPP